MLAWTWPWRGLACDLAGDWGKGCVVVMVLGEGGLKRACGALAVGGRCVEVDTES